jgi:hypothetical protein
MSHRELPVSDPPPPETQALFERLLEDDRARQMWHLETLWNLGNEVGKARGDFEELKGEVISIEGQIVRLDNRVTTLEHKHDDFATRTGEHQLTEIRAELQRHEESKRHWVRWAVAALAMLATSVGTGCALHWLF